ncbi:hypothetical protein [Sinimarinibacterium thermocellulolyticum]|uniref:Alginate export domain-containing protein n=1 Tax=Sinimarinibacterium thermocellulolyticum TaxID=3170016 RepID=A0ABV2A6Q3_9GAMM
MASKMMLAVLLTLAVAGVAQAQDERRRPGERAERNTEVPQDALPKPAATPRPAPLPPPSIQVERRRPGESPAPVKAPAPAPAKPVQAAVPAPASPSGRRRPGQPDYTRPDASGQRAEPGSPLRGPRVPFAPNRASGLKPVAKPGADAEFRKQVVPDRWQLTRALGLTDYPWYDPYNQNTLKGDRPVRGDWFFAANLTSDTIIEPRRVPTPVGAQAEGQAGQLDLIGSGEQLLFAQTVLAELVYLQGNTTFRPPDWEFRFQPAFGFNDVQVDQIRALRIDPRTGTDRRDQHFGVQQLFVDKHLRNVSDRYDFDSLRIGIQPFTADFRGFLFQDQQLGVRLFGTRDNNLWQYNLAYFRRLEKDTNSLLNDLGQPLRKDDIVVFNLYRQDFPVLGHTSQAVILHNRNREGDDGLHFNQNGFIERPASIGREFPRNYDVTYVGVNGDGHFGRLNLTSSAYFAFGDQDEGVLRSGAVDIRAFFLAAEASVDFDWRRIRVSALYASADDDPFDDVETGFDAVLEAPLFAGGLDTNFWTRQSVPLIGGGIVGLSGRNGQLNSLRSSLLEGQSNFANPGTVLLGVGADLDLAPTLRVSFNVNQLWFADSAVVEIYRNQGPIDEDIGLDVSVATIWRPFATQNVIFRGSAAALVPGEAYEQLFGDETGYSVLLNLILNY